MRGLRGWLWEASATAGCFWGLAFAVGALGFRLGRARSLEFSLWGFRD